MRWHYVDLQKGVANSEKWPPLLNQRTIGPIRASVLSVGQPAAKSFLHLRAPLDYADQKMKR